MILRSDETAHLDYAKHSYKGCVNDPCSRRVATSAVQRQASKLA